MLVREGEGEREGGGGGGKDRREEKENFVLWLVWSGLQD